MSLDTRSSTVTIDTDEMVYPDIYGVNHTVTNGQTFVLKSVDDSVTGYCTYYVLPNQTPITTTDGYVIAFAPGETTQGERGFTESTPFTVTSKNNVVGWTIPMVCPVSGVMQYWKVQSCTMSDLDFSSAGTMQISLKDQFDNEISMTGITVGQAA
jgi:hypothetical protein